MIATTFSGESVYLLPYRPDWSVMPSATFSLLTVEQRSLQGNEARKAYVSTLRTSLNFNLLLLDGESSDFRVGLQRLENKRILCPFWPAAAAYYDSGAFVYTDADGNWYTAPSGAIYTTSGELPTFTSGIWFTFEPDLSAWEVHTTLNPSGFTPSTDAIRVPLMLGYFKASPNPKAITPKLIACDIAFFEAGPVGYALTPIADDSIAGLPLPTGVTPKLFPCEPNWATMPEAGQAAVEITREQIGFTREPAETYYPQNAQRAINLRFLQFTWGGSAQLVKFFLKRQGTVESFWMPGALDECRLTQAMSTSSTMVHVDRVASLGDNRFLAFIEADAVELRAAISVDTGANTLTLDANPAKAYQPDTTRIASALLCRFRQPLLKLDFTTDRVAETSISFVETPNEYQAQSGETTGTTIGALPRPAYLYRFIRKMPGLDIVDRFTSYEASVNLSGEVFTPRPFSHKIVIDALDTEQASVQLSSRAFVGNPLLLVMPNQLEVPLHLQIIECSPDASGAATTSQLRFYGRIRKPNFKGPVITADVGHILQELDRVVPRHIKQPVCNYRVFSTPCGLAEASFTATATIVSQSGNQLVLSGLSIGSPVISYFAHGRLWYGSGSAYQTRTILESTVVSSGQITITINRSLSPLPTGSVSLSPGCNKTRDHCENKFINYHEHFGGFLFVPVGNPSLVAVTSESNTGGKK